MVIAGIGIDCFNDTMSSYELYSVFHIVIPITLSCHPSFRVHYDPSFSLWLYVTELMVSHLTLHCLDRGVGAP